MTAAPYFHHCKQRGPRKLLARGHSLQNKLFFSRSGSFSSHGYKYPARIRTLVIHPTHDISSVGLLPALVAIIPIPPTTPQAPHTSRADLVYNPDWGFSLAPDWHSLRADPLVRLGRRPLVGSGFRITGRSVFRMGGSGEGAWGREGGCWDLLISILIGSWSRGAGRICSQAT